MIGKIIVKIQDWADVRLRRLCGRLTPGKRLAVILTMLLTFSFLSVYMTVTSIYNWGKRDARKEFIKIEHIRDFNLPREQDSINSIYKHYDYGTAPNDTGRNECTA